MKNIEVVEPFEVLKDELKAYFKVCEEVHLLVQSENQLLRSSEPREIYQFQKTRRDLLERLSSAQRRLSVHKSSWMRLPASVRVKHPVIPALIRKTLDLIMKTIVLDRENEQFLLRHQMVPPSGLPSAHRQNPRLVAQMYVQNRRVPSS